jgi:hypothetical protein
MTKRIEQSRRHGHHDARWTGRIHAVSESSLPLDEPDEPKSTPPTLTLVGGTDPASTPSDPIAAPGS